MPKFSNDLQPSKRGLTSEVKRANDDLKAAAMRVLNERDGSGQKRLVSILRKHADRAVEGDVASTQLLLDRAFGKVPSAISYDGKMTHEVDASSAFVQLLERMNSKPGDDAKLIEGKVAE